MCNFVALIQTPYLLQQQPYFSYSGQLNANWCETKSCSKPIEKLLINSIVKNLSFNQQLNCNFGFLTNVQSNDRHDKSTEAIVIRCPIERKKLRIFLLIKVCGSAFCFRVTVLFKTGYFLFGCCLFVLRTQNTT